MIDMYTLTITPITGNHNRQIIIIFNRSLNDDKLYCTLSVQLGSKNSIKKLNIKWNSKNATDFHKKLINQKYDDTMCIVTNQQPYAQLYKFNTTNGFKWSKPIVSPVSLQSPIIDEFELDTISDIINLSLPNKFHANLSRIICEYVKAIQIPFYILQYITWYRQMTTIYSIIKLFRNLYQ
jgi:hypothetical protein